MWLESLLLTILLIGLLFFLLKRYLHGDDDFWPSRGVTHLDMNNINSFFSRITFKVSFVDLFQKTYDFYPDLPYFGYMQLRTPVLFIKDLDLLRHILVKDFDHFTERNAIGQNKNDLYLSRMLLNLTGQEWKDLRSIMTPTFTTGKIKGMVPLINNCGQHLVNHLKTIGENGTQVTDFHELFGKFTIDAIASIAFGMDTDAFQEDSVFRSMSKKFQKFTIIRIMKVIALVMLPRLASFLRLSFSEPESTEFFSQIVKRNIQERRREAERGEVKRPDFLQLMIDAQDGQLKAEGEEKVKSAVILDDMTLAAQCLLFFLAGSDTMETALTFTAHSLAVQPEIQEKLAEEVTKKMEENGGELTYDGITQMEYLDMVVSGCVNPNRPYFVTHAIPLYSVGVKMPSKVGYTLEEFISGMMNVDANLSEWTAAKKALRLYPPAFAADRLCIKEYMLPDTQIKIPKGTRVLVPINAIQKDAKYYPNPLQFNPENFNAENKANRHSYAYLPFGQGPRNCIALRFAMIEAKAAIAHLIYNFKIEPSEKTDIPAKFERKSVILKPANGLHLKFSSRR